MGRLSEAMIEEYEGQVPGGVFGGGVLYVPVPLPPCLPPPPGPVANRALVPTPRSPNPAPATAPPTAPTVPSAAPALAPPIPPFATLETVMAKPAPTAENCPRRMKAATIGIKRMQTA
jgi:hypothetical protein